MSGGQQQDDKNSMALLWGLAGIFVVGTVIWVSYKNSLISFFLWMRYIEISILWYLVKYIPFDVAGIREELHSTWLVSLSLLNNPSALTLDYAAQLSSIVGSYIRYPLTLVMGYFCYLMYGKNVKRRYKKRYDMKKLAAQESAEWPQINPVVGQDIVKADINNGPWAMAMTPLMFCKKYKLISIEVEVSDSALGSEPKFHMILDQDKADRVFASQLGKLWKSPERLPMHKQALFAAFIARGCRDSDKARNLLDQINKSCMAGKLNALNFTGVEDLWKKHYKNREIQEILKSHAYENTLFTALFLYARQDGVFATADFLWLKPLDRKFWYVLNNVGRQTPAIEAAGVHAHFLAEKALKRPLGMPMVGEAVKGLQLALDEVLYVPSREERDELLKNVTTG